MSRAIIALLVLFSLSAQAEDATVRAFHDSFFAAWNQDNPEGLIERLTEDTIYHPHGAQTLVGRDAVGANYVAFLSSFDVRMDVFPEVLESFGDHGIMQGTYRLAFIPKEGGERSERSGRYHMDLVKGDDGGWLIAHEVTQTTTDLIPGVMTAKESASVSPPGKVRRRFADITEGQVHYWQGGPAASDKTPILFLHPGPHSARVQTPLLDVLAELRPVYAPDIMGMGDSSPPPESDPDLAYFADAVLQFADATGLGRFAVYGSNLSARIGTEMALQQPERIHTLILNRMVFFEGGTLDMWAEGHVPNVQPDQEGAYVTFLWSRLRDLNTYVPWFEKGAENLRGKGLPSADILHLSFVEQVKMAPTMHLAFDAYWAYPLAEKLSQLGVRTVALKNDATRIPNAETWAPTPLGGNVISATSEALMARARQLDALIGD